MKKTIIRSATVILVALAQPAIASELSLESAPPVVVKTMPVAGATEVDPELAEIRVTFSKAMQDRSWSWSTWGEENFPETAGEPRYLADGRTAVLPVKLRPGRFYATWLNSERFENFKDRNGRPAVPYLLTFVTASRTAASGAAEAGATKNRKFVRIVLDGRQMTFEGEPANWAALDTLLPGVPDRDRTVLEWAVSTAQITLEQQNEWSAKFAELARAFGFEYSSYVGVHPFGSKGGAPPQDMAAEAGAGTPMATFGPGVETTSPNPERRSDIKSK
jgi:RNA polymerase sigma-70 factor (ECF subfamily)